MQQYTIKELRARTGLSQESLGKMLNVSTNTINTWEKAPKIIKLGKAQELADVFGITLCEIFLK